MHDALKQFIAGRCERHDLVKCPVKAFASAFRLSLPPEQRRQWPRTAIVTELAKSFRVALDEHSARFYIYGLGLPAASHLLTVAG
jgi:hypothetical protein